MSLAIGWGELAALTGAFLFGIANVVYRSQREEIDVTSINALKNLETVPCLALLVIILGIVGEINDISLTIFVILGISVVLGLVLGDLIYLKAQEIAGVSRALPIAMTFPFITYLAEIIFLRETFLLSKGVAISVIVLGVILIGRSTEDVENHFPVSSKTKISQKQGLGVLFALWAAFLWAGAGLTLQVGVENVDPIIATLFRATVASLMLMPIVGMNSNKMNWRIPPSRSILIVLIAGFFGMTIGALLYVTAVKLSGASTAAAITATAPVITIPLAVVFLDEKVTSLIILGTILTVLGVLLLIL